MSLSNADLDNPQEVLDSINSQMKEYYRNMDYYDQDLDGLVKLGSRISTLFWFIASEEAKASAKLDLLKAEMYSSLKESHDKMTIPDIESQVQQASHEENVYSKSLANALRAMDRFLTQVSIRIKNLRKERLDSDNPIR
jgi:hypothetical protein